MIVAFRRYSLLPVDDYLYALQARAVFTSFGEVNHSNLRVLPQFLPENRFHFSRQLLQHPHLTRSSLHRCFQRHNISRLPQMQEQTSKPKSQKFKTYPIGYFHIDIAQLQTSQGKLYMFVAIDRTSKFVLVELVPSATKMQATAFLNRFIETVPYKIHTRFC